MRRIVGLHALSASERTVASGRVPGRPDQEIRLLPRASLAAAWSKYHWRMGNAAVLGQPIQVWEARADASEPPLPGPAPVSV